MQHLPLQPKVIPILRPAENSFTGWAHNLDAEIVQLKGIVVATHCGGHGDGSSSKTQINSSQVIWP